LSSFILTASFTCIFAVVLEFGLDEILQESVLGKSNSIELGGQRHPKIP
jgi:hypothetical protein